MSEKWWGKPFDARRYHIFIGDELSESLCGKWMFTNDGNEPRVTDDDEYKSGQDCKACCREAGVLNE